MRAVEGADATIRSQVTRSSLSSSLIPAASARRPPDALGQLVAMYLTFQSFAASWGGLHWERQIRASAAPRRPPSGRSARLPCRGGRRARRPGAGMSVLVTGAAGFVGKPCSLALRKRGDGVVGIDNFNAYYDPSFKKARKAVLSSHGVYVVEGDINDGRLLAKLLPPPVSCSLRYRISFRMAAPASSTLDLLLDRPRQKRIGRSDPSSIEHFAD